MACSARKTTLILKDSLSVQSSRNRILLLAKGRKADEEITNRARSKQLTVAL
jgi:hypothetical protein